MKANSITYLQPVFLTQKVDYLAFFSALYFFTWQYLEENMILVNRDLSH